MFSQISNDQMTVSRKRCKICQSNTVIKVTIFSPADLLYIQMSKILQIKPTSMFTNDKFAIDQCQINALNVYVNAHSVISI